MPTLSTNGWANWTFWFASGSCLFLVITRYLVVSNIFYFHLYWGKWSNLTPIFQLGWDHQVEQWKNAGCSGYFRGWHFTHWNRFIICHYEDHSLPTSIMKCNKFHFFRGSWKTANSIPPEVLSETSREHSNSGFFTFASTYPLGSKRRTQLELNPSWVAIDIKAPVGKTRNISRFSEKYKISQQQLAWNK